MAYSTQRAVSNGSLNLLDISLDYFDRAEISVYFDNIVQTTGWSWVGATEKKISFTPNVPAGVEVLVVRTSDLEAIRHEYSGGAQFTAETLDENMRQLLYIAQEARENANIEDVYRDLNMHGYKLKNVGAGVDPTDAITVQQAAEFIGPAETAAALAEQWASGVGVVAEGKYSAKHYSEQAASAASSLAGAVADIASAQTSLSNLISGVAGFVKAKLGQAANTTYNFLFDASAADGTLKLQRENGQQIMTVDANGKVAFPQNTQGWYDLKGSRTFGSTYTNLTGRDIDINVAANTSTAGQPIQLIVEVNGTVVVGSQVAPANVGYNSTVYARIPAGAAYRVNQIGAGTVTITYWQELR